MEGAILRRPKDLEINQIKIQRKLLQTEHLRYMVLNDISDADYQDLQLPPAVEELMIQDLTQYEANSWV
jgi:hypothetical protein